MFNPKTTRQPNGWRFNRVALAVAVALGGVAAMPGQAFAAAPAANTPIGNVATATYVDSASVTRNATSNTVTTIVQQVASFVLTQDNTRQVTAGTQVVFPHSLTNTGNGSDTFTLTIAQSGADQFDLSGFHLYADTNNDGVPDGAALDTGGVATVTVAAGDTFNFVLVGSATPTSGYNTGDKAVATVVADTTFDTTTATQTNTDTATLTSNAVINVVKSANKSIGPNGTTITYTLRYTNTGNKTATNVTISDVIQAGLVYQSSTGKWNGTSKTDGTGDDEYAYNSATKTVSVVIPSVAPNTTGEITFDVVVNSAPGILNNTGAFNYDPDGTGPVAQTSDTSTNTVPFTVQQTANVAANASDTNNAKNGGGADIVNAGTTTQGATVTFVNRIWNNSNGTDSFNIGLSGSTFPAGTTFQLYKSDGTNVLVDTNGDGIVDTGPVAAGAKYDVIVKAILPAGASGNNDGAGFTVTKTATSTAVGAIIVTAGDNTDTVVDKLDAITANTVDITNNAAAGNAGALGTGAGTAAPVSTNSVNPGVTTTFQLYVKNTSTVSDNFNLTASNVPAGWTVDFQAGTCGATSSTIANTGTLAAGASVAVCAVVSVPATAAPSTNNITFTSVSPNSGASDYKVDAVTVNTVHQLQLVADRNGTVSPGGSISYSHTITNLGNVTEGSISLSSADSASGFSTAYYTDVNGNGVIDGGDTAIPTGSTLSLAAGASVKIITQVTSPSNAADGATDFTTVSATASAITVTNTDTTRVSTAQVRLVKSQAYDAGCDGTADGAFTTTNISAKPNECIIYQVVATNEGSTAATTVVISDTTPAYTTMASTALAPTVTVGSIRAGAPANGATGTLYADVGTLGAQGSATPNSATLTFEVRIDH